MHQPEWLSKIFERNVSGDVEEKRRNFVFYFISYIGGFIILLFAMQHINSDRELLKTVLFSGFSIIFANVITSHFFKQKAIFTYVCGVMVVFMILGLVYSGGYKNTGLYWVFPFPFVLFVLLGYQVGVIGNALLFGIVAFLLANQHLIPAEYSAAESSRFLSSFVATVFLMLVGEYFRAQSHREMETINVTKDRQANTDPLTKLPNRRFLDSVFFKNAYADPSSYFPLTVIAVDIDHFKSINDQHGHHAGDQILKQFADVLNSNSRNSDVVARTGGEEFIILFPQTDLAMGHKLAEKLREKVESFDYVCDAIKLKVTASFGVANALTEDQLNAAFKAADANLYLAKEAGRNQVK
ncbi:GGDEF domain-containing protein [Aliikangiella sp. IMCC44653]